MRSRSDLLCASLNRRRERVATVVAFAGVMASTGWSSIWKLGSDLLRRDAIPAPGADADRERIRYRSDLERLGCG